MSNNKHVLTLREGKTAWNNWMKKSADELPKIVGHSQKSLRNRPIKNLSLTVADLSEFQFGEFKEFQGYNFKRVKFNSSNLENIKFFECEFKKAQFHNTNLQNVVFEKCTFEKTDFLGADLNKSKFIKCKSIHGCNFGKVSFYHAEFRNSNINHCSFMWSKLIETKFVNSELFHSRIFGASIWNLELDNTVQNEIIITKRDEIDIYVDNLEIAQFLYLMITNSKISSIIDTLTSKVVLILGRFTEQRKPTLDAIKLDLSERGYVPVIFDFQKPNSSDFMEPVLLIAQMARFVIADFSDAKIILEEVPKIVDNTSTVVVPILVEGQREPVTLENLRINRRSILKTYIYTDLNQLLGKMSKLIAKAEKRFDKLQGRR